MYMKQSHIRLIVGSVAATCLILVALATLLPRQQNPAGHLHIVASANFWGSVASQIGGDRVKVTSLIDEHDADPHAHESGASDASGVTTADMIILNGLGFDEPVEKLLVTAPRDSRTVLRASDFITASPGQNPHLWYHISEVPKFAEAIERELSKKDPAGSATYKANLATFLKELQPLQDRLQSICKNHPGAPIAYTERVAGYLIQDACLKVVSPESFAEAIENGNEPSPSDQAAMLSLISDKQIRVLIYNAQAESPVTEKIRAAAATAGIPVVAVTETMPEEYATYQAWQYAQLDALAAALDNSR